MNNSKTIIFISSAVPWLVPALFSKRKMVLWDPEGFCRFDFDQSALSSESELATLLNDSSSSHLADDFLSGFGDNDQEAFLSDPGEISSESLSFGSEETLFDDNPMPSSSSCSSVDDNPLDDCHVHCHIIYRDAKERPSEFTNRLTSKHLLPMLLQSPPSIVDGCLHFITHIDDKLTQISHIENMLLEFASSIDRKYLVHKQLYLSNRSSHEIRLELLKKRGCKCVEQAADKRNRKN